MTALTLDGVCDRLLEAKDPLILTHRNPDGDTVGSAAALCRILQRLGKSPAVLTEPTFHERYAFLLKDIPTEVTDGAHTVIAVDLASPQQLGSFAECFKPDLQIDHHEFGTPFADHYVVPAAAACGEVVLAIAKRLCERGALSAIDPEIANPIYAAISSDTGCFCFSNVTPDTHRYAAELLSLGVPADEINHRLFHSKSKEQLAAEGYVLSHLSTAFDGKVCAFVLPMAERERLNLPEEAFDTAIDMARSLAGVRIAVTVKEKAKGQHRISLRSTDVSVTPVAAHFGGGGHARAAGCTVMAESAPDALSLVLDALKSVLTD